MGNLAAASLIWALSFGLIKHVLIAPGMHPYGVSAVRLALACSLFVPWMRWTLPPRLIRTLMAVGAVQYGLMYLAYTPAFWFLDAHLVVLFTVTTPLYVALIHDGITRRLHGPTLGAALLAVIGGSVVAGPGGGPLKAGVGTGVTLVQLSNVAFAVGQIAYRRTLHVHRTVRDVDAFGWLYAGGVLVTLGPGILWGARDLARLSWPQAFTLLYLGLIPSGLGFYLWNRGARRAAVGTVAAMNNAKLPLGVLGSVVLFGERPQWLSLVAGGTLMVGAVVWAERSRRSMPEQPDPATDKLHDRTVHGACRCTGGKSEA